MKKYIALLFILFLIVPSISFGHSGGTDANGGHNSSTGYHYHHGYPAHQHENGQCPYEFDDKTGWNSGSINSNGNSTEEEPSSKTNNYAKEEKPISPIARLIGYTMIWGLHALTFCSVLFIIYIFIFESNPKRKEKFSEILHRGTRKYAQKSIIKDVSINSKTCYAQPIGPEQKRKKYEIVYITKSGTKYHSKNCKLLKGNEQMIDLMIAKNRGYSPCSKCNPPK